MIENTGRNRSTLVALYIFFYQAYLLATKSYIPPLYIFNIYSTNSSRIYELIANELRSTELAIRYIRRESAIFKNYSSFKVILKVSKGS